MGGGSVTHASAVSDAKAEMVRAFLTAPVEPGSTVVTDGYATYGAASARRAHRRRRHGWLPSGVKSSVTVSPLAMGSSKPAPVSNPLFGRWLSPCPSRASRRCRSPGSVADRGSPWPNRPRTPLGATSWRSRPPHGCRPAPRSARGTGPPMARRRPSSQASTGPRMPNHIQDLKSSHDRTLGHRPVMSTPAAPNEPDTGSQRSTSDAASAENPIRAGRYRVAERCRQPAGSEVSVIGSA